MLARLAVAAVLLAATAVTASPIRPTSVPIRPAVPFPAVQITFDVPAPPTTFKVPAAPRLTVAEAPLASHPAAVVQFRVSF